MADTRTDPAGTKRRHRECTNCGERWATLEVREDWLPNHIPKPLLSSSYSSLRWKRKANP